MLDLPEIDAEALEDLQQSLIFEDYEPELLPQIDARDDASSAPHGIH